MGWRLGYSLFLFYYLSQRNDNLLSQWMIPQSQQGAKTQRKKRHCEDNAMETLFTMKNPGGTE